MLNHYDILGINKETTQEDIKKAYHQLAQELHPDKYHDNPLKHLAEEQFKKVNEAYQILNNPEKREKYDRTLNNETSGDQQKTYNKKVVYCKEHSNIKAETYCLGCNQPLCAACARQFNLQLCPDCLMEYNREYIKNLKTPFIKTVIALIIGFMIGMMSGEIDIAIFFAFYFPCVLCYVGISQYNRSNGNRFIWWIFLRSTICIRSIFYGFIFRLDSRVF